MIIRLSMQSFTTTSYNWQRKKNEKINWKYATLKAAGLRSNLKEKKMGIGTRKSLVFGIWVFKLHMQFLCLWLEY